MYLSGPVSYLFEAKHIGRILKNNSKKRLCLGGGGWTAESITLDLADRLLTNWKKFLIRPEKKRKPLLFLSSSSPPLSRLPHVCSLLLCFKARRCQKGVGSNMQKAASITKVACKIRCQHAKLIDV